MLRQFFRHRGTYNFVNLPYAATQDDPSYTGYCYAAYPEYMPYPAYQQPRGDPNLDWRRYYNPALEPEFRRDVGLEAWDRPNWYEDTQLSSTAAAKILRKRLETYGPQRERSLQEVISRIRTEKDAQMALKAAELFRRYRSAREQHTPFKLTTSKMIVQRALEVDARDVALEALERKDELGFNFMSLKAYRLAITYFSTKRDLQHCLKVFELAKKQGLKPNRDIGFCLLRACLDCERPDMAYAYAIEFQENGIRISPAQKILIEAGAGKPLPPFRGEEVSPSESSPEPVEDQVLKQADLIIAAANEANKSLAGAEEAAVTVNAEGTGETVGEEGDKVVTEPAVEESSGSDSGKVVAAIAVEPEVEPKAAIADKDEAAEEEFDPSSVPGLDKAVSEKMRMLFPAKEQSRDRELRRMNSI